MCWLQAEASQVCYILAGVLPQHWAPEAQLCLPGADHARRPRSYASLPALQASDILEWAVLQSELISIGNRCSMVVSVQLPVSPMPQEAAVPAQIACWHLYMDGVKPI